MVEFEIFPRIRGWSKIYIIEVDYFFVINKHNLAMFFSSKLNFNKLLFKKNPIEKKPIQFSIICPRIVQLDSLFNCVPLGFKRKKIWKLSDIKNKVKIIPYLSRNEGPWAETNIVTVVIIAINIFTIAKSSCLIFRDS